jgi:hypothetical protein
LGDGTVNTSKIAIAGELKMGPAAFELGCRAHGCASKLGDVRISQRMSSADLTCLWMAPIAPIDPSMTVRVSFNE